MTHTGLLIAALFVPLFPLSMVFNLLLQRLRNNVWRALVMLVWPLPGVWLLQQAASDIPHWFVQWAILSALLYSFRAVVIRDMVIWAGYLATSSWALLWLVAAAGIDRDALLWHVLAFSLPLAILMIIAAELERRYESAYAGVVSGVAQAQPRLAAIFVMTLLAIIASPVFPAFFAMLNSLVYVASSMPVIAIGIVCVWLIWSWSAMRLLQDLLVGSALRSLKTDISVLRTIAYALVLLLLAGAGLYLLGMTL